MHRRFRRRLGRGGGKSRGRGHGGKCHNRRGGQNALHQIVSIEVELGRSIAPISRPFAGSLEVSSFRWRNPVKKAPERRLCALYTCGRVSQVGLRRTFYLDAKYSSRLAGGVVRRTGAASPWLG
jgi:hypothetical protein